VPAPPESSSTLGLLLRQRHGTLGVLVPEQPLRRVADFDVEVRVPETPAQLGNDRIRDE